jgi:hypothetical protein
MVRIENDCTIYGHFQKIILDILPVYLTGGISADVQDALKDIF